MGYYYDVWLNFTQQPGLARYIWCIVMMMMGCREYSRVCSINALTWMFVMRGHAKCPMFLTAAVKTGARRRLNMHAQ
jgi:hypothetical protein